MAENENAAATPAENTPSQTLFRFVSLRSPQLSDDKNQDKKFILFPEEMKSNTAFYKPVVEGAGSKKRLLLERAQQFANTSEFINDVNTLKEEYGIIYDFSSWLARNKSTCTYEEFNERKQKVYNPNPGIDQPVLLEVPEPSTLWNNLIFQVVTQKDFYIKETVMQMLLATHILQNSTEDEKQVKTLLAARIVLPKEMMMDEDSSSTSQTVSRLAPPEIKESFPTEEMQKQQKIASAKTQLSRFEALKKNLLTVEKQYSKAYQSSFDTAKEIYEREIAPTITRYKEEVAAEKDKYCGVRPPGTIYDPKDPCMQPREIPYPDLPKFEFNYKDQVNGESMISSLKAENLETLLTLLGYDFSKQSDSSRASAEDPRHIDALLEGRNTFAEIHNLITESTERNNNTIVENTSANEEMYVSIGGIIMPMAKTVTKAFTYQLCPRHLNKVIVFDLALTVPDSSWDVSYAHYNIMLSNGSNSFSMDYYSKSRTGNTIFLSDLFKDGISTNLAYDSILDVKITFTNGKSASFSIPGVNLRTCVSSAFELQVDEGQPPIVIDDENTFIPSGFGFKQIGIADYLKVEQTTHAYVEGEVAHIENVMAREYREKSTRRLRRSENTTTSSSDTEREQLSDTTTANRFEMQSEIAKIQQESRDTSISTHFDASWKTPGGGASFNTGIAANYANHKSKEESTRQAVTQSQDITARAMDRIVAKVHEERIEKIIEEFEETNSHGLDNRKGDKHVVGVYRWVDKLMKNQIYNYGKRMMFEFMIPEPAKLHLLGMANQKVPNQTNLVKPIDPRTSNIMQMKDYSSLFDESILKYWSSKYNVELDEKPSEIFYISKSFSERDPAFGGTDDGKVQIVSGSGELEIPQGYEVQEVDYKFNTYPHGFNGRHQGFMTIAGKSTYWIDATNNTQVGGTLDNFKIKEKLAYSFTTGESPIINGSISAKCFLTAETRIAWQQKTFKAIIDAYEEVLVEYNNAISEEENKAVVIKDSNPNFYRQIENTVLRKNCISYMADRAIGSTHGYGLEGLTSGSTFGEYETVLSSKLDKYTTFIKFMEQAFEWENISYFLYPYYWGKKTNWSDLYQSENTDPLFRNFLQSGMARVVATVRPGFEDVVQFYLATGKIWNGGEVPVIGDELYLSIVDEMKEPKGLKQGKAWLTRLPTTLNILQAESIGLKVAHALPFTTENPDDFEVPSEVITEDKFNFEKNDNVLGGNDSTEKDVQITFNYLDKSYKTIDDLDMDVGYPRHYECMGQEIKIDRDAKWAKTDSTLKFYDALADEISKIDGVKAFPSGKNGILFRIDINKIKHFKFSKAPHDETFDVLEFFTDGKTILDLKSPSTIISSLEDRYTDKNGNNLAPEEYGSKISLSRFLV